MWDEIEPTQGEIEPNTDKLIKFQNSPVFPYSIPFGIKLPFSSRMKKIPEILSKKPSFNQYSTIMSH